MARHNKKRSAFRKRNKLSRPQWEIYSAGWQPEARFRTAVCGRRFGKTTEAIEEIRRAIREAVRHNISTDNEIWYAAPNAKQAKRVFWNRLKKGIPEEWLAKPPYENDCHLELKSGHIVRLVGLDNYDALRGSGLWFVVVDEWADCPYEAWTETLRPMLSTAGGHALFIGTPKGFNHLYDSYRKGQPGAVDDEGKPITDHKSWSFTTEQGGNVPRQEIEDARRDLDAKTFRQEYQATFETYEGRVLFAFSRADNVRPCRDKLAKASKIFLGVDFNINPMSCVVIVEEGEIAYQVDEVIIPTANTDDLVAELQRRYGRNGSMAHVEAYPDPAGAQRRTSAGGRTDISILQGSGIRVIAMASHPLVRDRNNVTNGRFCTANGNRRLFVDPACGKSIEAYERHVYKPGTSEPDKSTGYDHIPDALAYYAFGRHAYKPPQQRSINIMGR